MKILHKKIKQIIAVACAVVMVAGAAYVDAPAKKVEAAEQPVATHETFPEGLKEITFSDFGIDDGTYPSTKVKSVEYGESTLNNTVFVGTFTFTPAKNENGSWQNTVMNLGPILIRTNDDKGLKVQFNTSANQSSWTYLNDPFLINEPVDMKLTLRYVDSDTDGATDDLQLGIWIDGALYENKYITYGNQAGVLESNKKLTIANPNPASMTVESVVAPVIPETFPEGLTEIKYSDLGIPNGVQSGESKQYAYSGSTLDNTVLSGKVTFKPEIGSSGSYVSTIMYWGGLIIRSRNDAANNLLGLRVTVNNTTINVDDTSLLNRQLNLKLTVQYVEHDNDGNKDDVKLGFWVDDVLHNNEYIYFDDQKTNVDKNFRVQFNNQSPSTMEIESVGEAFPEGLTEITYSDLGVPNGAQSGESKQYTYSGSTLDNTVLSGKVTFKPAIGSSGSYVSTIMYWGGLIIRSRNDAANNLLGLRVTVNSTTINVDDPGLLNKELNLKLTVRYVEHDGDGNKDDVQVGIWVDDVLHNNQYIYFDDAKTDVDKNFRVQFNNQSPSTMEIESVAALVVPETFPEGLTYVTYSDLGVPNGTQSGTSGNYTYSGSTLDNTVLSGKVTFKPAIGSSGSYVSTIMYWGGLIIRSRNDAANNLLGLRVTVNSTTINVDDPGLLNKELNLKLTVQYVEHDNDGNKDDVQVGIWVDDVLHNNQYIYFDDAKADVDKNFRVQFNNQSPSTMEIESVAAPVVPEVFPAGLTEIKYSDLGIPNGAQSGESKQYTYSGSTLDNTVLSGKVTFKPAIGSSGSYVSTIMYWGGLLIRSRNDASNNLLGLRVTVNGTTVNVDDPGLLNRQLNLKLSVQYVEHDNDGNKDDVKLGIWVDDVLHNNQYIYFDDQKTNVDKNFYVQFNNQSPSTMEIESVAEAFPEGLTEITYSDLGIPNGVQSGQSTQYTYSGSTLDNTVLSGKVTFQPAIGSSGSYVSTIMYWGGLLIRSRNDASNNLLGLRVTVNNTTINVDDPNLLNRQLNLKLTVQYVEHDNDGNKDDVQVGIWVDDVLHNNQYLYFDDEKTNVDKNFYVLFNNQSPSTMEIYSTIKVEEHALENDWKTTTANIPSVSAAAYDIYLWGETQGYVYSKTAKNGLAGNRYYMTYTVDAFEGTENKYGLVGTSEPKEAYPFTSGKGLLYSGSYAGDANPLFEEGYTYFVKFEVTEDAYKYTVLRENGTTKEMLSLSECAATKEETAFAHFGIYLEGEAVNAKLSNVRFWSEDGTDLDVASNSSQAVLFEAGYKKETTESYNLKNGAYVITGTGPITVTGEAVASGKQYKAGDTLNTPGTYKIVTSYGLYTKNVTLYDGEAKSTEISTEDHVMPIAGFYGPYRSTDKNGTYRDFITDDVFAKMQDMGLNLIVANSAVWSEDGSSDDITQSLLLAEKYGLGVYVSDPSLLKEDNVTGKLDFYSNYSSFKGIHIIDEPTTGSYYGGNRTANSLASYANVAQQLNQYVNLNGYINLLGINKQWADDAGAADYKQYYATYLDEYLAAMEGNLPHHLSSATYVYSGAGPGLYFDNLAALREQALESDIPFWTLIQAGSNFNDEGIDMEATDNSTPTEGQFQWNVNTALAYGAQGIQYFPLVQPSKFAYENSEDKYDYERNGLIGADGKLTTWGTYVEKANRQIAVVDEVLMDATSVKVLATGRKLQSVSGISDTSYGKLTKIQAEEDGTTLLTSEYGALVGVFSYRGKEAFYVVNGDDEHAQDITLTFDASYNYRKMNHAGTSYGTAASLKLTDLKPGEAVLIVLGEVIASPVKADLSECDNGVYTLPGDGVISIWNAAGKLEERSYANWPNVYSYSCFRNSESYVGKLVVYRAGDVTLDNQTNLLDLVRLKKGIDESNTLVWTSALEDATGTKLRALLIK